MPCLGVSPATNARLKANLDCPLFGSPIKRRLLSMPTMTTFRHDASERCSVIKIIAEIHWT